MFLLLRVADGEAAGGHHIKGMTAASRKLVEESAANGRSLVISEDGEVKRVWNICIGI